MPRTYTEVLRDEFNGPNGGTLNLHVSDSGHQWSRYYPPTDFTSSFFLSTYLTYVSKQAATSAADAYSTAVVPNVGSSRLSAVFSHQQTVGTQVPWNVSIALVCPVVSGYGMPTIQLIADYVGGSTTVTLNDASPDGEQSIVVYSAAGTPSPLDGADRTMSFECVNQQIAVYLDGVQVADIPTPTDYSTYGAGTPKVRVQKTTPIGFSFDPAWAKMLRVVAESVTDITDPFWTQRTRCQEVI